MVPTAYIFRATDLLAGVNVRAHELVGLVSSINTGLSPLNWQWEGVHNVEGVYTQFWSGFYVRYLLEHLE